MIEAFGVQWGTLFQLLTTLFSAGIFGVIATFYVNNRKLTLDAAKVLREHYAIELERLNTRANDSDDRHERCEADKRLLRRELDDMHQERADDRAEINGLKIQISRYSANKLMILEGSNTRPSDVAPEAVASAPRVIGYTTEGGSK